MPVDALIQLQASVTKTATFNGAALILPGGTPRRGMVCRVIYSAATQASGSGVWTFSVDVCYDGVPTTWRSDFVGDPPITLTTTAQQGELFIPFSISPTVVAGVITAPQIRLTATLSGSPVTPTITYQGDLSLTRP
jgi:hypothetical protein